MTKTAELAIKLDDVTLRQRSLELANRMRDWDNLEAEKKETVGDYNQQLKEIDLNVHRLADVVRTGEEMADVAIEHRYRKADLMMEIWRLDTNELVTVRPANEGERQKELFDEANEAANEATQQAIDTAQAEHEAGETEPPPQEGPEEEEPAEATRR